jgi:hypothetical protein
MDEDYIEFDLEGLLSLIAKPKVSVETNAKIPAVAAISEAKPEQKRPKRCQMAECKQKLALTDSACKCSGVYCMKHRHAEVHSCTFDYKGEGMNKLKAQLPEVRGIKLENI